MQLGRIIKKTWKITKWVFYSIMHNFLPGRSISNTLGGRNPGHLGPIPVLSGPFCPISGVSHFGRVGTGRFGPISYRWDVLARFLG